MFPSLRVRRRLRAGTKALRVNLRHLSGDVALLERAFGEFSLRKQIIFLSCQSNRIIHGLRLEMMDTPTGTAGSGS